MKIITHTSKDGETVYIQVKDLLYMGRTSGNRVFVDEYVDMLNSQKSDNDFIRVYGEIKRAVLSRTDIIEFKETYKEPSAFLSRTLINLSLSSINDEVSKKRSEDIRDVLAFKRGELDYGIPLLSDGDLYLVSENGLLSFGSTIIPDCFVLKSVDYGDIKTLDYQEFLSNCLDKVKSEYDEKQRNNYSICQVGNIVAIKFNRHNKRKDNKLLNKLKKVKNKILKNED